MAADANASKDLKAHLKSYARFTFMMKWGAICAVLVGFLVILVIYK